MSGLQEAGAAIWVDLLHRGLTQEREIVSDFFSYMNFLILQHLCVSCSVAFGWLSFHYPAGGRQGTSSGFWAPGQRLQAQPGAVCWDICTEQTRGMRRDKLFMRCWVFSIDSIKANLLHLNVVCFLLSVSLSALKCVLNLFGQLSCLWGLMISSGVCLISLIHQAAKQNHNVVCPS